MLNTAVGKSNKAANTLKGINNFNALKIQLNKLPQIPTEVTQLKFNLRHTKKDEYKLSKPLHIYRSQKEIATFQVTPSYSFQFG